MNIYIRNPFWVWGEYMQSRTDIKHYGCLNKDCPDYGIIGNGNIIVKELRGKHRRALLKCKTCNKTFCETHGTPFFALKTPIREIANTLVLIPELGSIRAAARYTNHKPDTIISWIELYNNNMNEFNEYFSNNLHYSSDRIEEFWTYINRRKRASNNKKINVQK
jgi:transposase-like protein